MTDDKESRLKEITEKLLKGIEPNEQLIKVLKDELLSPVKDMTENLIPHLKRFMESLKDRNDNNIGFNNIEISKKEDE